MAVYNHGEYIKKHRRLTPEESIGRRFVLIENGDHGRMMCKGYTYELLAYHEGEACPYEFTSDYGRDVPYKITEGTFRRDMRILSDEEY